LAIGQGGVTWHFAGSHDEGTQGVIGGEPIADRQLPTAILPPKNSGDAFRVPHLPSVWSSNYFFLLVFFAAFLVAFFVAIVLFSLPFVATFVLLQLVVV
jgi:hypothetical protein